MHILLNRPYTYVHVPRSVLVCGRTKTDQIYIYERSTCMVRLLKCLERTPRTLTSFHRPQYEYLIFRNPEIIGFTRKIVYYCKSMKCVEEK